MGSKRKHAQPNKTSPECFFFVCSALCPSGEFSKNLEFLGKQRSGRVFVLFCVHCVDFQGNSNFSRIENLPAVHQDVLFLGSVQRSTIGLF